MDPPGVGISNVIAYVDGFNLYHGLKDSRGRKDLWLDLHSVLASYLQVGQQLVAVHYFTALVNGSAARLRQQTYLDALQAHPGTVVTHVGRFQSKTITCRACRQTFQSMEEKESDVSLAVQIVEDGAAGRFDTAFIVSGDSDMIPAVRSVRRTAPSKRLVAIFPPKRSSVELQGAADATLRIYPRVPRAHQLPHTVVDAVGNRFTRPQYWS